MAHSNSPEKIGKKMCEKWRLWDLRIKPCLFAILEVIYSGKKRIHEIVNAHTISQGVSDGISCVRNTWNFFFDRRVVQSRKKKISKKYFFVRKRSGCFKTSKFEINFFSGWNFFFIQIFGVLGHFGRLIFWNLKSEVWM